MQCWIVLSLSVSTTLNVVMEVMEVMLARGGWRCSTWLMFGLLTVAVSCGQQKLICIEVCYLHTPVSPNLTLLLYDRLRRFSFMFLLIKLRQSGQSALILSLAGNIEVKISH